MSVKIADCSLRDGGYVGNKNFPVDFIKGVIKGLVDAGIDYIETGFLQTNVTGVNLTAKIGNICFANIRSSPSTFSRYLIRSRTE